MGQSAGEIAPRGEDGTKLWTADPPPLDPGLESAASVPDRESDEHEIDGRLNEIERTRAELSGTIDALQERLAPQHLVDQAKDAARETTTNLVEEAKEALREGTIRKAEQIVSEVEDTARGMRTNLMDMIQENPVPAAMAGIGLGWLFMESRGRSARPAVGGYSPPGQAQGKAEEMVGQARDAAGQLVSDASDLASDASETAARLATRAGSKARGAGSSVWDTVAQNPLPAALAGLSVAWLYTHRGDKSAAGSYRTGSPLNSGVGELTDRAKGQFEDLGSGAQQQAQRAQGQLGRMLEEAPLAVGAVALGLGAAIGLAVPTTSRERELMGETRDTFMEKAQQAAQDAQHRLQEVGEQVQQTVKQEVQGNQMPDNEPSGGQARPYGERLVS